MSGFSFSKLKQAKPSMRRRLFLYMGALAALLLVVLFAALLLLGQLKSPREELSKTLTFRMEAFQSDMESLWRNVSVMGLHLSEDMTAILEKQTTGLSKLDGDVDAEELEQVLDLLRGVGVHGLLAVPEGGVCDPDIGRHGCRHPPVVEGHLGDFIVIIYVPVQHRVLHILKGITVVIFLQQIGFGG